MRLDLAAAGVHTTPEAAAAVPRRRGPLQPCADAAKVAITAHWPSGGAVAGRGGRRCRAKVGRGGAAGDVGRRVGRRMGWWMGGVDVPPFAQEYEWQSREVCGRKLGRLRNKNVFTARVTEGLRHSPHWVFEYSSTRPSISDSHSETRVLEHPFSSPSPHTEGYARVLKPPWCRCRSPPPRPRALITPASVPRGMKPNTTNGRVWPGRSRIQDSWQSWHRTVLRSPRQQNPRVRAPSMRWGGKAVTTSWDQPNSFLVGMSWHSCGKRLEDFLGTELH